MNVCLCGHARVLHNGDGPCVTLMIGLAEWALGCGCQKYQRDTEHKGHGK